MNIYMAACYSNAMRSRYVLDGAFARLSDREKAGIYSCNLLLESYHYCKTDKLTDLIRQDATPIFLDSGAFSAYTLNAVLTVKEYCDYIHRNKELIRVEDGILLASVLDGIGDPLATWRNQHEMELRGVRPLPCFHAGEDEKFLEHYIKNYEYITLGGMVGGSTKQLTEWLDHVWGNYLTDGAGRAKLKVHGFGITSVDIMERYPWHSVDSSAWIQAASFGEIVFHPHGRLIVSDKSSALHVAGRHIETITDIEKEYVLNRIASQGYNYERLATVPHSRAAYNIDAFGRINADIDAKGGVTFKLPNKGLF